MACEEEEKSRVRRERNIQQRTEMCAYPNKPNDNLKERTDEQTEKDKEGTPLRDEAIVTPGRGQPSEESTTPQPEGKSKKKR